MAALVRHLTAHAALVGGCAALGVLAIACSASPPLHAGTGRDVNTTGVVRSNVERADYAGSAACGPCHAGVSAAWERSPMHRMTRDARGAEVRAPFDGKTWRFKDDVVALERHGDERFVRVAPAGGTARTYRVTRVIGGRTREDFAGVEVGGHGEEELVLPVSYVLATGTLRYKGYSVMVHERATLRAGPIWSRTCVFCHNTVPEMDRMLGAIAGPNAPAYQGEQVDRWLPAQRRAPTRVTDPGAFAVAASGESERLGGSPAAGEDPKTVARHAIDVVRAGFDGRALVEVGIGCEACHGGALEHTRNPGVHPSFTPVAPWLATIPPRDTSRTHSESIPPSDTSGTHSEVGARLDTRDRAPASALAPATIPPRDTSRTHSEVGARLDTQDRAPASAPAPATIPPRDTSRTHSEVGARLDTQDRAPASAPASALASAPASALASASAINRVCARCHQVLFSRYPFTWEGGRRDAMAGGSHINSGEGRDFLLGGCATAMACTTCHDPHGGAQEAKLRALATPEGNGTCTACHTAYADRAALKEHAHHDPAGAGGSCVGCHMPRKNMGLTGTLTRYHRIGSPTDAARVLGDRPLECALCHVDKTVGALVDAMEAWWPVRYPRQRLEELYGSLGANAMRATLERGKPHERAVAIATLGEAHDRSAVPLIAKELVGEYPLVREWAKRALASITGRCDVDLAADDATIARGAAACGAPTEAPAGTPGPSRDEDPED